MAEMDKVFQSPPIIENIFNHLSARDLSFCAQVCKLWGSMSAIELKRRHSISWFFQLTHKLKGSPSAEDAFSSDEDVSYFENNLKEQFRNMRVKPSLCIALATEDFYHSFEKIFLCSDEPEKKKLNVGRTQTRRYLQSVIKRVLRTNLPASTKVTFAVTSGVIGCFNDYSTKELEFGYAVSGICIPDLPGVEVHHLPIINTKCELSDITPKDRSVKCLLILMSHRGHLIVNKLVESCLVKENRRVAIGGAVVEHTESPLGSAISFCGTNLEASSLIISPKDKAKGLENKLKIFQETGLLKNRCFAFMFVCLGRGYHFHDQTSDFESTVFRSMYPKVPLIGVFGNGEIGHNYFPHLPPEENKLLCPSKFINCKEKYLLSYTTVFVLISIKD